MNRTPCCEASTQLKPAPGAMPQRPPKRAGLGVILPSVNTVVEPWFNSVAPAGVNVHASRMLLGNDLTIDALRRMDEEQGMQALYQLISCQPDAIAYCCTASSIVQGLDYDQELKAALEKASGKPCVTALGGVIDALNQVKAKRICVASPYPDRIDEMEHEVLRQAGFEIKGSANLGIAESYRLAEPGPDDIHALVRRAWSDSADALLITCLNMHSHFVIDEIELKLRKPVISSTQAILWKLLRLAGIPDPVQGWGRLLRDPGP